MSDPKQIAAINAALAAMDVPLDGRTIAIPPGKTVGPITNNGPVTVFIGRYGKQLNDECDAKFLPPLKSVLERIHDQLDTMNTDELLALEVEIKARLFQAI